MEDQEAGRRHTPRLVRIDVLSGLFVCLAAALIWFGSASLTIGELRYFGPGFLSRIFAALLAVAGLALLFRGLTQSEAEAERLVLAGRGPLLVGLGILFFAMTIHGSVVGSVVVPPLGLLIAGPVTVFIAGLGSVEAEPRELVVLGMVLSAVLAFVFVDLLSVQIPVLPAKLVDSLPLEWGFDWPRRVAIVAWFTITYVIWRLFKLTPSDLKERKRGDGQ